MKVQKYNTLPRHMCDHNLPRMGVEFVSAAGNKAKEEQTVSSNLDQCVAKFMRRAIRNSEITISGASGNRGRGNKVIGRKYYLGLFL